MVPLVRSYMSSILKDYEDRYAIPIGYERNPVKEYGMSGFLVTY